MSNINTLSPELKARLERVYARKFEEERKQKK